MKVGVKATVGRCDSRDQRASVLFFWRLKRGVLRQIHQEHTVRQEMCRLFVWGRWEGCTLPSTITS